MGEITIYDLTTHDMDMLQVTGCTGAWGMGFVRPKHEFKDKILSNISTVMALVVKLESSLYRKLEKMSYKANQMTSVFPFLLQHFIYIPYESLFFFLWDVQEV